MGKKRIAIVGEQPQPKKEKPVAKSGKQHGLPASAPDHLASLGKRAGRRGQAGRISDMAQAALAEAEKIEQKEKEAEKQALAQATKKEEPKKREQKIRGKAYLQAKTKVQPGKYYPPAEAIKLLKETKIVKFNASVDVHLNVKQVGLKGTIAFPHPTGKQQNIRIADDQLLKELEQGKIIFSILLASPAMMPKLVKYAKTLGPKGLMPNPKAGTITDKPEEIIKKMSGQTQFKTEPKAPLIHQTIGKIQDSESALKENLTALIKAVGPQNIQKAVLVSAGPAIKVALTDL